MDSDSPSSSPPCQSIVNYFGFSSSDSESESQEDAEVSSVPVEAATSTTTQENDAVVREVEGQGDNGLKLSVEAEPVTQSDEPSTPVQKVLELSERPTRDTEGDETLPEVGLGPSVKRRKYTMAESDMGDKVVELLKAVKDFFTKPLNLQRFAPAISATTFDKAYERIRGEYDRRGLA